MIPRITHSPLAETDLDEISDYFAGESFEVAIRFSDAVKSTEKTLLDMPKMGVPRKYRAPELKGLRMLLVNDFKSYLIFYKPTDYGIHIVRVLHGARDLKALFK
ncbi:MAG: plasmid stabilization system protein [Robiginitomaculum sp.]|nr:MAG: plasmid stabilization system protein [Robiginitomaculum sp.]